jgi:hypothetical protein
MSFKYFQERDGLSLLGLCGSVLSILIVPYPSQLVSLLLKCRKVLSINAKARLNSKLNSASAVGSDDYFKAERRWWSSRGVPCSTTLFGAYLFSFGSCLFAGILSFRSSFPGLWNLGHNLPCLGLRHFIRRFQGFWLNDMGVSRAENSKVTVVTWNDAQNP